VGQQSLKPASPSISSLKSIYPLSDHCKHIKHHFLCFLSRVFVIVIAANLGIYEFGRLWS